MKRMIAAIMIGLMMVSLVACGLSAAAKEIEPAEAVGKITVGGFTDTDSPAVTDEVKALLEKATESLTGAEYTPVAYLGTQVVAGTNHLILCKVAPIVPDAKATYALVTVYEDLNGNAEITEVQNCEAQAPVTADDGSVLSGGYTEPETPEVTAEAKAALSKACVGLDGAAYEAKALLGTQVVAGTNYSILCKVTPVTPNAAASYAVVTVYEDLNGNAEISETFDFAAV